MENNRRVLRIELFKDFRIEKHDPIPSFSREEWQVFGYYDSMNVEPINLDSGRHLFESIYVDSQQQSRNADGKRKKHVIYAISINQSDIPSILKKEQQYPLVSISLIHFYHPLDSLKRPLNYSNAIKELQHHINAVTEKLHMVGEVYISLDCNDAIILWQGESFQEIMQIVSKVCIEMDPKIREVFTIHACKRALIDSFNPENPADNEELLNMWLNSKDRVFKHVQVYLRNTSYSHAKLLSDSKAFVDKAKALCQQQQHEIEIPVYVMPGQEDVLIDFQRLPLECFIRFYRHSINTQPESVDGYLDKKISRTVILAEPDAKNFSVNESNYVLQTRVLELIEKLKKAAAILSDPPFIVDNLLWYSALMELLVELSNIEVSSTAYDIYVQAISCQERLIKILCDTIEEAKGAKSAEDAKDNRLDALFDAQSELTANLQRYLNGWSQLSFHAMHAEWQLTQTSDINRLYVFPAKLSRLYCGFMEKSCAILNNRSMHEPSKFFLTPNISNEATFVSVFRPIKKPSSLIHGEVPADFMFSPQILLPILIHEAAHYSGKCFRNRKGRYSYMMRSMIAYMLSKYVDENLLCSNTITNGTLLNCIVDELFGLILSPEEMRSGDINAKNVYYGENLRDFVLQEMLSIIAVDPPIVNTLLSRHLVNVTEYCNHDLIQRTLATLPFLKPVEEIRDLLLINDDNNIACYFDQLYQIYNESFSDVCMITLLELSLVEYLSIIHRGNRYHHELTEDNIKSLKKWDVFQRYVCVIMAAYGDDKQQLSDLLNEDVIRNNVMNTESISRNDHNAIINLATELLKIHRDHYKAKDIARAYASPLILDYLKHVIADIKGTIEKETSSKQPKDPNIEKEVQDIREVYKALARGLRYTNKSSLLDILAPCAELMHGFHTRVRFKTHKQGKKIRKPKGKKEAKDEKGARGEGDEANGEAI